MSIKRLSPVSARLLQQLCCHAEYLGSRPEVHSGASGNTGPQRRYTRRESVPTTNILLFRVEQLRSIDPFTLVDDLRNPVGGGNVLKRIAVNEQQVGIPAFLDRTDVLLGTEQA